MRLKPKFGWNDFFLNLRLEIYLRAAPAAFDRMAHGELDKYKREMGVTHRTAANGRVYEI